MRSTLKLLSLATLVALAGGSYVPIHAALMASDGTYFVDCVAGSDANPGTSATSAWRSLSPVNGHTFAAGDTISLARGCSWDGGLRLQGSGTTAAPITLTAYGTGTRPTIRNSTGGTYGNAITVSGDYVTVQGLLVRDAGSYGVQLATGADHNTIRDVEATAVGTGFQVQGQYNLLSGNNAHDLKMIVNTVGGDDDYGAVGYWLQAPNNEVANNTCRACRAPSSDYGYDGGFVEIFNNGDNSYVHGNWASDTDGFFEVGAGSAGGSARNIRVAYNVLENTHGGLCLHNAGNFSSVVDNFQFDNNTFVKTTDGGYKVFDCLTNPTPTTLLVRNNIFDSNIGIASSGNFTHTNNLYDLTNGATTGFTLNASEKTGDPGFTAPTTGNYHLTATSPARNAGTPLPYTTDFDNKPLPPNGPTDLGAYSTAVDKTSK